MQTPAREYAHVVRCYHGMSLVRKIGDEIRRGDTTAQYVTKSYIEKVGWKMYFLNSKAPRLTEIAVWC
jgi:hypothetical protein